MGLGPIFEPHHRPALAATADAQCGYTLGQQHAIFGRINCTLMYEGHILRCLGFWFWVPVCGFRVQGYSVMCYEILEMR